MSATPSRRPAQADSRDLLSSQVTGSAYVLSTLNPGQRGWSLALGGREQCAPDYLIDRSRYAFHVLEYVIEGCGTVELEGRSATLAAGSVFAYAPDMRCVIRTEAQRPMRKFFFALAGKRAAQRLTEAGLSPGTVRSLGAHAELLCVAEDLLREGQRAGPHSEAIRHTLMELFLLKLAEASSWSSHGSPLARDNFLRCRAIIDGRAESLASLEDLAREAGMDVSSICRLFRRFQGTSPYQYLLRRKMNLAAELLVDSGCLVKEAAQRVGFEDPFHFARCFKAVHGVAPSAVRGFGKGGNGQNTLA